MSNTASFYGGNGVNKNNFSSDLNINIAILTDIIKFSLQIRVY